MDNENIKKIAQGMGYKAKVVKGNKGKYVRIKVFESEAFSTWDAFDPYENQADAFKVLEALIGMGFCLDKQTYCDVPIFEIRDGEGFEISDVDLKKAICEAYLAAKGKDE